MTPDKIKSYVNFIIQEKSQGNQFQEMNIKMKLMLKGIPVNKILEGEDYSKADGLEELITQAANDLNVELPNFIMK